MLAGATSAPLDCFQLRHDQTRNQPEGIRKSHGGVQSQRFLCSGLTATKNPPSVSRVFESVCVDLQKPGRPPGSDEVYLRTSSITHCNTPAESLSECSITKFGA